MNKSENLTQDWILDKTAVVGIVSWMIAIPQLSYFNRKLVTLQFWNVRTAVFEVVHIFFNQLQQETKR